MFCGLAQMYQHFKRACFLHSILLFPSTLKMEATNAGAIQTKYMASHLHHSFQISEQYSEGTITCPTHPLQATTIFSCLFATTFSYQLTQNCEICRNTVCDAMCLSHTLLSWLILWCSAINISH